MAEVTLPVEEVEFPVYKLSYTFKIRNFDKLLETQQGAAELISSEEFCHPDTPDVKWRIRVFPCRVDGSSVSFTIAAQPNRQGEAKLSLCCGSKTWEGRKVGNMTLLGKVPHGELEYSEPGVFEVTAGVEYVGARIKVFAAPKSQYQLPEALDFSSVLFSGDLSDFSLVVEGQKIPVHKVLLASASPVFKAMFAQSGTREAVTNSAVLKDTSAGAVKRLLRFVYTGRLDGEVVDGKVGRENIVDQDEAVEKGAGDKSSTHKQETSELVEVLGLSGRYDVAGLGEAAEVELRGRVDEDSVLPIAAAADLHGFPRLFKLCRGAVLSGRVALSGVEELLRDQPALFAKLTAHAYLLP